MRCDIILAGVGGQGILTIAGLLSRAAARAGLHVKQSEVHGMSQRGGAVQAHVRIADTPVHSELIPLGEADLILAVEPLEALRYVQYLRPGGGAIVAAAQPVANITDYPDMNWVRRSIAAAGPSVVLDAAKLAREAGSGRAENTVMLGAASNFVPLEASVLVAAMNDLFAEKGPKVQEMNRRAFDLGRRAAAAAMSESGAGTAAGAAGPSAAGLIDAARSQGRTRLFEHEVYQLLQSAGGIAPPRHLFVAGSTTVTADRVASFSGDRVVVKAVSPDVAHKTEAGGVRVVPRDVGSIQSAIGAMRDAYTSNGLGWAGALLVQFVEHDRGLGGELFVGLRVTREFGPILAAGFGGVQTEFLAQVVRPEAGVVMAPVLTTSSEAFLAEFKRSAAYRLVSGGERGAAAKVPDARLAECFAAFLSLAKTLCDPSRAADGVVELEVNPFAVAGDALVPLDGRATLGDLPRAAPPRPAQAVERLIAPRSIAVLGVSSKRENFGRIIVRNIRDRGFAPLCIVKEGEREIDGVPCVPSIDHLPGGAVDLLVACASAEQVPQLVADLVGPRAGKVSAAILISGGVGEKEGTEQAMADLRRRIADARGSGGGGGGAATPVFLGTNCMGVRSAPGRYDTFFIPPHKLPPPAAVNGARPLALVSQSGAFVITRASNLAHLDPAISVSLGNQVDVTAADVTAAVAARDDIHCIGVYVEGFADLDGLAFARAVADARRAGKSVVFYKAGRTPAGRTAAQGHTASLAGDWDVCAAAVRQAGAIVATSFREFERLVMLATCLHGKSRGGASAGGGRRVAVVSNAGYETVGMADAIIGAGYALELPPLPDDAKGRLSAMLAERSLAPLVNARNPLDLTPMADDEAYESAARELVRSDAYDAVVVGVVPMTPQLLTTPEEIARPGSIAARLVKLFRESPKPLLVVIDAAEPYEALADHLRSHGVPVFGRADEAMATLGRWLEG